MDAIFDVGAEKVFSEVAFSASCIFPLDKRYLHFDTTSVNVWGDYSRCSSDYDSINITYGYSKDQRPDLKQFLVKMLCVGRNIPILGGCEEGNSVTEKTVTIYEKEYRALVIHSTAHDKRRLKRLELN